MPQILLVDDDDSLRKMLCIRLVQMGHEVFEAQSVEAAMSLLCDGMPDVLITDIIMPGKPGLEIIRELHNKHPQVKIIAMSGGARGSPTGFLKMAQGMGADCVLRKPFSNEKLAAVLARLCGSAKLRS